MATPQCHLKCETSRRPLRLHRHPMLVASRENGTVHDAELHSLDEKVVQTTEDL